MCDLYKKIESLCEEKGVTIYRLCMDAKIPFANIYDLKNGKKDGVSLKTAKKIAEYFGVPVDTFVGSENFSIIEIHPEKLAQAVLREINKRPSEIDDPTGSKMKLFAIVYGMDSDNADRLLEWAELLEAKKSQ